MLKFQDVSIQLKEVVADTKVVELVCPYTRVSEVDGDKLISEMKFQLSRNGINEFHFIISDGAKVIKKTADL